MLKRRKPYRKYFLILLLVGSIFSFIKLNNVVIATVYEMAEVKAVQLATETVNNAVRSKMSEENVKYQDFVEIHKDSAGKIVLIQANAVNLNKVATETTLAVQSSLLRLREETLYIPLGQVTGIYFLTNIGPGIRVDIVPIGTVRVEVADKFDQSGINQTRHSIYFIYNTDVRIVIPLKSGRASVVTQVPVTENIIIGEVPNTYVSLPEGLLGPLINK